MDNAMVGLISLNGIALLLITGVVLFIGAGIIGFVLWALWQLVKQRNTPPAVPPVHSPSSPPPKPVGTCPRCGATLPPDSPQGLCPRCMLGVGLATHTDATGELAAQSTKAPQAPPPPEIGRAHV